MRLTHLPAVSIHLPLLLRSSSKTDGWFWAPSRRRLPTAKLGIAPALLVPAVAPSRHRVLACGLIDPYTPRRGRGRSPPTARGPRRSPQERRRLSPRPPRPARRSVVPAVRSPPLREGGSLRRGAARCLAFLDRLARSRPGRRPERIPAIFPSTSGPGGGVRDWPSPPPRRTPRPIVGQRRPPTSCSSM